MEHEFIRRLAYSLEISLAKRYLDTELIEYAQGPIFIVIRLSTAPDFKEAKLKKHLAEIRRELSLISLSYNGSLTSRKGIELHLRI